MCIGMPAPAHWAADTGVNHLWLLERPDHPLHVVHEVGEPNLGTRSGHADRADEQAQGPVLPGAKTCSTAEQTADLWAFAWAVRRGIGLLFRLLAVTLRAQAAGEEFLVGLASDSRVGPRYHRRCCFG